MSRQEYRQLQAEQGTVERILDRIPEDRVIDRIGLEARLEEIGEQLGALPVPSREPARARLTFRGKPVVGNHGVFVKFGASALGAFTDAVAAMGVGMTRPLKGRGPIPARGDYRLLITGTAIGSFGFELEEAPREDLPAEFPGDSLLARALDRTQNALEALLGTDDELAEAVEDADPRALAALHVFLETLARNGAVCTLDTGERAFRFTDVGQVERSVARLSQENIHEEKEELIGRFQGVLPHERTFELRVEDTGRVILGKIGKDIDDPVSINRVLDRAARAQLNVRRVGQGRPRYVLLGYEEVLVDQDLIEGGADD